MTGNPHVQTDGVSMATLAGMTEPSPQAVLQLWEPDLAKRQTRRHPLSSQAELKKAMERKLVRSSSSCTSSGMASVMDVPSLCNPDPWAEPPASLLSPTAGGNIVSGDRNGCSARRSSQIQIEVKLPCSFQRTSAGNAKGGLSNALSQITSTPNLGSIISAAKQEAFLFGHASQAVQQIDRPMSKLLFQDDGIKAHVYGPAHGIMTQPDQLKLPEWAQGMDYFGFVPAKPCNNQPTSSTRTSPVTCCSKAHKPGTSTLEWKLHDKSATELDASCRLYDIMATKEYSPGVSPTQSQSSYEEHHLPTPLTQQQVQQTYNTRHTTSSIPTTDKMASRTACHDSCCSICKSATDPPIPTPSQSHLMHEKQGLVQPQSQLNACFDCYAHSAECTSIVSPAELPYSKGTCTESFVQQLDGDNVSVFHQQPKRRDMTAWQRPKQTSCSRLPGGTQKTWLSALFGMLDNALSVAVGDDIAVSNSKSESNSRSATAMKSKKQAIDSRGVDAVNWRMRC